MFKKIGFLTSGILVMMLANGAANAENVRVFEGTPDPNDLANFLFSGSESKSVSSGTTRTRSWVVQEETPSEPATNVGALQIQFEFDSTEFKPYSLTIVERLAQALITEQAGDKPVMIEGHTDAIGTEAYNLDLSKRRAKAVRDYLIDIYRIEPARLFVDGRGESDLLNPANPKAAANRRVQIRQFGKSGQASSK